MTYTQYCLTDAMLRRLNAIVNGDAHKAGSSLIALKRRELITENTDGTARRYASRGFFLPTDSGRAALARARQEGW